MTKGQWISLVKDFLAGGDAPSEIRGKYHPAIIEQHIGLAYRMVVFNTFKEAAQYGDYSQLDSFSKSFTNVEVQTDDVRGEKFSDVPTGAVSLPQNHEIRYVGQMGDRSYAFLPMDANSQPVFDELEVSKIAGPPSYYVEPGKIFYDKLSEDITKVFIRIIMPLSAYGEDEDINIPGGSDKVIFDSIVQILSGKKDADYSNNNNPDKS